MSDEKMFLPEDTNSNDSTTFADDYATMAWEHNKLLYQDILDGRLVKGIEENTLNPTIYGQYAVQRVFLQLYIFKAIDTAAYNSSSTDLSQYLRTFQDLYKGFSYDDWHLERYSSSIPIVPKLITLQYATYIETISKQLNPVYTLNTLMPNARISAQISRDIGGYYFRSIYKDWYQSKKIFADDVAVSEANLNTVSSWYTFDQKTALQQYDRACYYEYRLMYEYGLLATAAMPPAKAFAES